MFACSALVRRTSLHEKDNISAKDAHEEALRFREIMSSAEYLKDDEDDDESELGLDPVTVITAPVCILCTLLTDMWVCKVSIAQ